MMSKPEMIIESIIKTDFCNRNNVSPKIIGLKEYELNRSIYKTQEFKTGGSINKTLDITIPEEYRTLLRDTYDDEQRAYISNRVNGSLNVQSTHKDVKGYITKDNICVLTDETSVLQVVNPRDNRLFNVEVSLVEEKLIDFIYLILKRRFKTDIELFFTKSFQESEKENILTVLKNMARENKRSIEFRPLVGGWVMYYTDNRMDALKVTTESSRNIRSKHWNKQIDGEVV